MGAMFDCCLKKQEEVVTPDRETMRQLQAQAIDKRLKENENRGIKDAESVKAKIAKKKEYEQRQAEADRNRTADDNTLRWQMN